MRCAEPYDDGAKEKLELPPLTVERDGWDVTVHGITRGLVVFGLLAGIAEPTEANKKNLDLFLEQFKAAGVQAIMVAGGVGLKDEHVRGVLDTLVKAPVPVLLCPGAEENLEAFRREIEAKRKTSPQLIDMTRVRRFNIANISVVSIPGYYKPFYLGAGEKGCAYEQRDLEKTAELFEKGRTTAVLSPTPPRGPSENSVDRSRGAVNIGDPALEALLAKNGVRFGLFGYVYESGGHATLNDGRTPVAPGVWQDSLFIQAGAAEALPMSLVGEGRAAGMAQIVEFSGGRARYHTVLATYRAGAP